MAPRSEPPFRPVCRHSRRRFLQTGAGLAASAPWLLQAVAEDPEPELEPESGDGPVAGRAAEAPPPVPAYSPALKAQAKVAVVRCTRYGPDLHAALARSFELLGGLGGLVRGRTVTVKLNLTGTDFSPVFGRPPGESYMTHPDSAMALAALLFESGATRVRFVESTQRIEDLAETVADAGWDVRAMGALGRVEWENTRNLGSSPRYATLKVPSGGFLFSSFELNRAYHDTDVVVSLCKLKNHLTCGVTLALKNLFGITPNSLYGGQAPHERATDGRGPLHTRRSYRGQGWMPGERRGEFPDNPFYRVPRIVADICEARPIQLSIIDGVTSMKGGEGPWAPEVGFVAPGVLIAGLNPLSTDAVGTAVMGYPDPRAVKGKAPFLHGDNHLLLAEQRGIGVLDLAQIEVVGEPIRAVVHPYG